MDENLKKEIESTVSATMEKAFTEDFNAKVEEIVAKHTENLTNSVKAFNLTGSATDAARANGVAKYTETVKYLNALKTGDRAALTQSAQRTWDAYNKQNKTLNESAVSEGGALVPIEFERTIIEYMNDFSQLRRDARVIQTSTNEVRLNELTSKVSVYKDGELVTATESDSVFGQPTINVSKWMGITTMSEELYEDSEINLIEDLARQFAEQLALSEQIDLATGTDSGQEGLLVVSGTTNIDLISGTTFGNITWDDLAAMQAALFNVDRSAVDQGKAKFYMSMPVYNTLRTLKTSGSGEYFVLPAAPTQKTPAYAWGMEIVVLNQYPTVTATNTKFVTLSDLSKHLIIADRRGTRITMHTEGTVGSLNLLTQDARAMRVTKRSGHTTALEDGIVNLVTN